MARKGKRNKYAAKAKKSKMLSGMMGQLETKKNIKNTALETGKDLLFGVVGGGFIGAAIGKPSLAAGAVITGIGHYMGNKLITTIGFGMMASGGLVKSKSVNGTDGLEGVKERMTEFKNALLERSFIDKLLPAKKTQATNGMGSVQYFNYADEELQGNLAALDAIEKELLLTNGYAGQDVILNSWQEQIL